MSKQSSSNFSGRIKYSSRGKGSIRDKWQTSRAFEIPYTRTPRGGGYTRRDLSARGAQPHRLPAAHPSAPPDACPSPREPHLENRRRFLPRPSFLSRGATARLIVAARFECQRHGTNTVIDLRGM